MEIFTRLRASAAALTAILAICAPAAHSEVFFLRGKVVMSDGSEIRPNIAIERVCGKAAPQKQANTDRKGQFLLRVDDKDIMADTANSSGVLETQTGETSNMAINAPLDTDCRIHATLAGYESNSFNLKEIGWTNNPDLPPLTLYPKGTAPVNISEFKVPADAQTAWGKAAHAIQAKNWNEAEHELKNAVTASPKFAAGWTTLAAVYQRQKNAAGERDAYLHAIAAQPKAAGPYLSLMRLEMSAQQWAAANQAAEGYLKLSPTAPSDVHADRAIVLFHLKDVDGAVTSAREALRLDPNHQWPRTEFVLGTLLEAKGDLAGASEHLKKYLEIDPKASDAGAVRLQIENLGKGGAGTLAFDPTVRDLPSNGEAWVPGGFKAFATMAHLDHTPTYRDFYQQYCDAILRQTSIWNILPIPHYTTSLQAYMAAVSDLTGLGAAHADGATVTISLANDAARRKAEQVLGLLGWKIVPGAGGVSIEPGDRPADALHQQIPAALGIDEIQMQQELEAGREFHFEVPSEKAMLLGGAVWTAMVKDVHPFPGGIADLFSRDWRMAKAYAGLSAMSPEAAVALVKSVGLQNLVLLHSEALSQVGTSFQASNSAVSVPGGAAAELAWSKLTGANPHDPPAFLRAVLEKDHGTLASFYQALYSADAARQGFFLSNPARAESWYAWYRASGEIYAGQQRKVGAWHAAFLQNVPLDKAGHVRYPGGAAAWGATDDSLADLKSLEALVPMAQLEEKRKAPLDAESARLLAAHYSEWNSLYPYFEALPGLNGQSFQALAAFSAKASGYRIAQRNAVVGEWHSLVELMVLGSRSGALDAAKSAEYFRQACEQLTAPDHAAKALAILRSMAGADADEAVPQRLLRLTGARRAEFDRARELQSAPKIGSLGASPDGAKTLEALSGLVYAALLDPNDLLVSEDRLLLRKHQFVKDLIAVRAPLFASSELMSASEAPGSYLFGGFAALPQVASQFTRDGGAAAVASAAPMSAATTAAASTSADVSVSGPSATDAVFRTSARLVEVHATVTDGRGRYVDDLPAGEFTIMENGKPLPAVAFEGRASSVSVALLFDTTGSMYASLPALRAAAMKLIGELRPIDSVAVYSFADKVNELQTFTQDKTAAKRAVLRTSAAGATALYDALVRVNRDLATRSGKKVIVVFTDGADNLSVLTTKIAVERAQASGIPIYTIAQGDALKTPALLKDLTTVSKTTGGVSFTIQSPNDIRKVFESVSQDLMHGYLLAFQPPAVEGHVWRSIEVTIKGANGRTVRARDGYYPE